MQFRPFVYKKQTSARAKAWDDICDNLKELPSFLFVTPRSCRERYAILISKFKKKNNAEIKATGIECDYNELDNLLQDLTDMENDATDTLDLESRKLKETEESKREIALTMRKRAMESQGETNVRESKEPKNEKYVRIKKETINNTRRSMSTWRRRKMMKDY
jgi:hypothetical protein